MNIFRHEFKARVPSALIWSLANGLLVMAFMSLYASFASEAAAMEELLSSMPRELLIAFGITNMDLTTPLGYFALLFVFVQLCLGIQGANYGLGLVSREETELTADFLLTRPVTRVRLMTQKLLAASAALWITALVVTIGSLAAVALFRDGAAVPPRPLAALLLSVPLFQHVFLALGLVLSLLMHRVRSVPPLSLALVFALYLLNAFGALVGERGLEVLSPFRHWSPAEIVARGGWEWPLVAISLAATAVAIPLAYRLYARRDIRGAA
ncbi:MAG: ABC transporter permease subunit [Anaerolineae bacterium]|jgi:ABC-2 type transport system permease protein|nr:ABC transporter permease subunit [Chloroflexota bacterium]